MIFKNIKEIDDIKHILEEASKDNHRNAENYEYCKMEKRWKKYLLFNVLEHNKIPVAFGGIVKFNNKVVRICDRYCTMRSYRRYGINKFIEKRIRYCADYFVAKQTQWAIDNNYQPFISMSAEVEKTNSIKRFIKYIDPKYGYRLLPDLYLTCKRNNIKCHQHIITNKNYIDLEKV